MRFGATCACPPPAGAVRFSATLRASGGLPSTMSKSRVGHVTSPFGLSSPPSFTVIVPSGKLSSLKISSRPSNQSTFHSK